MRKTSYFSLIEVMIAMAVLALAMAFMARMVFQSTKIDQNNQEVVLGTLLAQEKMEETFRQAQRTSLSVGTRLQSGQGQWESFQWERTVNLLNPDQPGLFSIEVTVSRRKQQNKPLIRLVSAVYQPATREELTR